MAPTIGLSTGFTDYGDYLGIALSRPLVAAGATPLFLPYLEDEAALAAALRGRTIAGAGVDVLSDEPPAGGNPLLDPDVPNLIVTPHVAWAGRRAQQTLADRLVDNIEAFVLGRKQ